MNMTVIERLDAARNRGDGVGTEGSDAGFTLIELMVVLLIMAILLAIAIPTFLGVKGGAQDRAAQSNLETALQNAKSIYGNNQTYGSTASIGAAGGSGTLASSEPSLSFTVGSVASTGQNTVSVLADASGNGLIVVNKSSAGDCWGILTDETTSIVSADPSPAGGTATAWPEANTAGTFYIVFKGSACSANNAVAFTTSAVSGVTSGWTATKYPAAV